MANPGLSPASFLLAWVLAAANPPPVGTVPVKTAGEAKVIAEKHTGGVAVRARPIPLNGATGGWAVDLHMPKEDRGWRCLVDRDSHAVFTCTRIPNPKLPKSRPGLEARVP